ELPGGKVPDVSGRDSRATRVRSLSTLIRVLRRAWREHPELVLLGAESGAGAGEPSELERWVRDAELVVALEVTRYLGWVLSNLRRICLIMLFSIVWTTAYLEVMPFPHHALMTAVFIGLATLGVAGVIGVMAYLSQDDVISRINGTPPGKITWRSSSLLSAMAFVMIPVLGLLSTEVEPVGRLFFGWIGDILRVLSVG
ncbi:MAG TPA: hypothetical protein VLL48_08525, partial [Longimicrobiales bacterium]|nr:hypothetical protein [Longimicrobiales bacterium]